METKEKLLRVLEILMDTDENSPVNATDVIKRLDSIYGIRGADRKGIYSDFALIEMCDFPLKEDLAKRKYYEHPFDDAELKVMMDAVLTSKCLTDEATKKLSKKIIALSSARGIKKLSHMIVPRSYNKSLDDKSKDYLNLILEATYLGKQVEFQYTEFDKNMKTVLTGKILMGLWLLSKKGG